MMRTLLFILLFALPAASNDLWDALSNNQMNEAKALLKNGFAINQKNQQKLSALHEAAEADNLSAIQFLLENGADPEDRSDSGETPVMYACKNGSLKAVKILVAHGAQLNRVSRGHHSPLIYAIKSEKSSKALFEYLLQHGADPLFESPELHDLYQIHNGLFAAMSSQNQTCYSLLFNNKPDPNQKFKNRTTLLMLAAFTGHLDLIKTLVADHADVNTVDDYGNSALLYATYAGADSAILEFLIENGADCNQRNRQKDTPLIIASALNEQLANIRTLVRHHADLNAVTNADKTALMTALEWGQTTSAKLLLDLGANPEIFTPRNINTLGKVLLRNDEELAVKILTANHIDMNRWYPISEDLAPQNPAFAQPLRVLPWAVQHGWGKVIDLALARGADPQLTGTEGIPLLKLALLHNTPNAFQILVSKGVPVDQPLRNEYLHWLVQNPDSLNTIATLIRAGAPVNYRDQTGDTHLMLAAINNQAGNVRELLKLHADPTLRSAFGQTALQYATDQGAEDCIQALGSAQGAAGEHVLSGKR